MFENQPFVRHYFKRVLREIYIDPSYSHIKREIFEDITEKVSAEAGANPGEGDIRRAVRALEHPQAEGKRYKKHYALEDSITGFLHKPLTYLSAPALFLFSAFCFFRLFPQREYVAFALCAAAAVVCAVVAYRCLYPYRMVIFSVFLPVFLLSFYPVKSAIAAKSGGFWGQLFSYDNHIAFVLIIIFIFFYLSALACFYIFFFRSAIGNLKAAALVLCAVAAVCAASAFLVHEAADLRGEYNALAADIALSLKAGAEAMTPGQSAPFPAPAAGWEDAAERGDALYERYYNIYVPYDEKMPPAITELNRLFYLYALSEEALVSFLHTSYEPRPDKPFEAEELKAEALRALELYRGLTAALPESAGLPDIIELEQRAYGVLSSFRTAVRRLYEHWIYTII